MGLNKRLISKDAAAPVDGGLYVKIGSYAGNNSQTRRITTGIDQGLYIVYDADSKGDEVWYFSDLFATRNHYKFNRSNGLDSSNGIDVWGSTYVDYYNGYSFNGSGKNYVYLAWVVSQEAGISQVSYSGNNVAKTITHNLGGTPEMIWVKSNEYAYGFAIYHKDMDATAAEDYYFTTNYLSNNDKIDDATIWNDTAPTSTVFSVGTSNYTNYGSRTMHAWCFRSIEGLSKISSFTGDAPNDVSVDCGFEPKLVMMKDVTNSGKFLTVFTSTQGGGVYQEFDNNTGKTTTTEGITFDSSGFTVKNNTAYNTSGANVIFYAVAKDL
jgi:hypothetical protein